MGASVEGIRIWFCCPDTRFAELISRALGPDFHLRTGKASETAFTREPFTWSDVVLLDLRTESGGSLDEALRLMETIKEVNPPPPVVAMTAPDDRLFTRRLSESGIYDTIDSPPDIAELRRILRRAARFQESQHEVLRWRTQGPAPERLYDLVGASESMQQVFALAEKIAPCDVNVLITGETGTGKSLLARTMHRLSQRAREPFVEFSCANMPEHLVEDELFGHEKGAFTGAVTVRRGRFEAANKGSLFLDEIGDLPVGLQAKLLRVLQERTFERLGSNTPRTADVRLICATHRNLDAMVKERAFREDLYYRLNVVQIHLPALRERREGIPLLAHHFLEQFAKRFSKPVKHFSASAMNALEEHTWPGNVRELENAVQRAVVLAEGPAIELNHLPASLRDGLEPGPALRSYEDQVRDFKRRLVHRTLLECGGNKAETARVLGLARGYLHRLISQLLVEPGERSPELETGLPDEDLLAEVDDMLTPRTDEACGNPDSRSPIRMKPAKPTLFRIAKAN